jgi:mono/diheme cytochrome c family protein
LDQCYSCYRPDRVPSRVGKGLLLSPSTARAFSISVLLVGVLMILASADASAQNVKSATKATASAVGDAVSGKRIYSSHGCYECHGGQGQGSTLSGPRVGPDPIPFSAFVEYLRQPAGQMPPYTARVISDGEIANIYAFLESLPKPASAQSIRLLSGEKKTSR